jgi:hypothetical protein
MELAVAKGASRAAFRAIRNRRRRPEDVDRRIPFAKYVALMRAGQELANDPALALHYGETNDMSDISIVGLIAYACETMLEAMVQLNRYGRLVVEFDGPKDRFKIVPKDGGFWAVDNRENPNDFPELTESTFRAHDLRPAPLRRDPDREGRACHASRRPPIARNMSASMARP